jgi:hypothetical protein
MTQEIVPNNITTKPTNQNEENNSYQKRK